MDAKDIIFTLKNNNTGGYFYKDNCRINFSEVTGFYCKDFVDGKMMTYDITEVEAIEKIKESLTDAGI